MPDLVLNSSRPQELLKLLEQIRDTTKKNYFLTADLLLEAHEGKYFQAWGYQNFGEWIENCGLDMSPRSAYYMVNIAKTTQALGIPREKLETLPTTSLKEIFRLNAGQYKPEMQELIAAAEDLTVEEVKQAVNNIKHKAGEEVYTYMNLKLPSSVKEVADKAFELVRMLSGNTVLEDGTVIELSDAKCLEYILVSFMNDPNNFGDMNAEEDITIEVG